MKIVTMALAAAVAAAWLLPAPADAATNGARQKRTRITVHANPKPKSKRWRGYGFLPGYRPQLAEINGLPILGPDPRPKREPRYIDFYTGQVEYGWGSPRYFRGRWNGGSFGPCWTYTPIGMMWNCN